MLSHQLQIVAAVFPSMGEEQPDRQSVFIWSGETGRFLPLPRLMAMEEGESSGPVIVNCTLTQTGVFWLARGCGYFCSTLRYQVSGCQLIQLAYW